MPDAIEIEEERASRNPLFVIFSIIGLVVVVLLLLWWFMRVRKGDAPIIEAPNVAVQLPSSVPEPPVSFAPLFDTPVINTPTSVPEPPVSFIPRSDAPVINPPPTTWTDPVVIPAPVITPPQPVVRSVPRPVRVTSTGPETVGWSRPVEYGHSIPLR